MSFPAPSSLTSTFSISLALSANLARSPSLRVVCYRLQVALWKCLVHCRQDPWHPVAELAHTLLSSAREAHSAGAPTIADGGMYGWCAATMRRSRLPENDIRRDPLSRRALQHQSSGNRIHRGVREGVLLAATALPCPAAAIQAAASVTTRGAMAASSMAFSGMATVVVPTLTTAEESAEPMESAFDVLGVPRSASWHALQAATALTMSRQPSTPARILSLMPAQSPICIPESPSVFTFDGPTTTLSFTRDQSMVSDSFLYDETPSLFERVADGGPPSPGVPAPSAAHDGLYDPVGMRLPLDVLGSLSYAAVRAAVDAQATLKEKSVLRLQAGRVAAHVLVRVGVDVAACVVVVMSVFGRCVCDVVRCVRCALVSVSPVGQQSLAEHRRHEHGDGVEHGGRREAARVPCVLGAGPSDVRDVAERPQLPTSGRGVSQRRRACVGQRHRRHREAEAGDVVRRGV
jgi:hypothetical protein